MTMRNAAVYSLCVVFLLSCGKTRDSRIVARVGKVQLTTEALATAMPSIQDHQLNRLQVEKYVQRWIEAELIYQRAMKEKIDALPEVKEQLHRLQKDFLVSVYVQQKVDREIQVTDQDLESYYEHNREEFHCAEDLYQVDMILTESIAQAREARARIAAGEEFALVAKSASLDPNRYLAAQAEYLPLRKFSPQLAAAIQKLKPEELSQPIKSKVGYHIVRIQELRRKGTSLPFAEVKELIVPRVRALKREEGYRNLIGTLSEGTQVSTDFSFFQ